MAALVGLAACGRGAEDRAVPAEPSALTVTASGARSAVPLVPGAAAGRDVVLVTLDTTRADHLGCYGFTDVTGGSPTPRLDRFAERAVRFADAVTPVPMTAPAHASLLTGLDPPHHGVRANGLDRLDPTVTTLAERLSAAGYDTAAFVSSFVLAPRFGLGQGFTVYDASLAATRQDAFGEQNERSAAAVTDAALAWIAARSDRPERPPTLLWVHYFDPHDPYVPPEPFATRYAEDPYTGEIAAMDLQVGRLLDGIRASVGDRSVVVIAGDHGESLGEHGEWYHSRSLYEGAVHVPLLIAVPDLVSPGVHDREVVGLIDVAPTLLDLLGIELREELDGRSLLAALASPSRSGDGPADRRSLYLETLNTYLDTGWAPLFALRSHGAKYIEAPRPEYYDLTRDPREEHDLLAGTPGAVPPPESAPMAASLWNRLAGQPDVTETATHPGAGGVDPEVRRRLQALGYLSAGGERPAAGTDLPDPKDMLPLHHQLLAAREALAHGDPDRAIRLARGLVRASPRDRASLQLLGEAYATRGELDLAERALRRHLAIGPSVAAEVLLAQVLMQQKRLVEAGTLLDAAAALDPDHGAVPLARGDLLLVQGRPVAARASYEEARRIDPIRFSGLSAARIERLDRLLAARRGGI